MITHEEIRHLAQLESPNGCAISFYFQPRTPQDKSHREELILVKDLVRNVLHKAERNGHHLALRDDLRKILEVAEHLHGNHSRGKVIFACQEQGIWRELDVPPRLGRSSMVVNSRFRLQPLVAAYSGSPKTCVALVDRLKARIFALQEEELIEKPELYFGNLPPVGKSDGYRGYDAGHRERHVENEVRYHFKLFAESLQALINRDRFELLLIGCRDETWPEIASQLSNDIKKRLLGKFLIDPGVASAQEVRDYACRMLNEFVASQERTLIREVTAEAQRNGRGALGLRHVLNALERQEVQMLVVTRFFHAQVTECVNCRHVDTRRVRTCAICGHQTKEVDDVSDFLVDLALRNGAETRFVDRDPDLEKAGSVGALLRFRADHNTPQKTAVSKEAAGF
jgi:peptide subunit release factor 1 (eRF1)